LHLEQVPADAAPQLHDPSLRRPDLTRFPGGLMPELQESGRIPRKLHGRAHELWWHAD
jgi:hypothetical protein